MDQGMIIEQGPPSHVLSEPSSPRLKLFLRRFQGDYLAV
jgi:ABC-type histidine transport system ATPase subunit